MCGGTFSARFSLARRSGLSPRVRGNRVRRRPRGVRGGSIPACAGEPCVDNRLWVMPPVYPRVCGGTGDSMTTPPLVSGLSPRVRGNPPLVASTGDIEGSIPACAGEPVWRVPRYQGAKVYPRVCGGTGLRRWQDGVGLGLSPRVRGNLRSVRLGSPSRRSIPACAGEPARTAPDTRRTGVYPRVCGGTPSPAIACRTRGGLSPRVRGNPLCKAPASATPRSIPACAGEPRPP